MSAGPLLAVRGLEIRFPGERRLFGAPRKWVRAVDRVDLSIDPGSTLALVGESGCGKTSLGRGLLRLIPAAAGEVLLRLPGAPAPVDLLQVPARALKPYRRSLSLVFQDPHSSLNPRMRAWKAVAEPLEIHRLARGAQLRARVDALLERVGIDPALGDRFPHEFSGGQRQRLGIARALAAEPSLVVCDEAVSALDVSVQAQILELLRDLQAERDLSFLFISHDLAVVRQVADRTAVMYLGRVVEEGPTEQLFTNPRHPYTRALLAAVPRPDPGGRRKRILLPGEPPSATEPPAGCPFHPRCPEALERCAHEVPAPVPGPNGSTAACLLAEEPTPAPLS